MPRLVLVVLIAVGSLVAVETGQVVPWGSGHRCLLPDARSGSMAASPAGVQAGQERFLGEPALSLVAGGRSATGAVLRLEAPVPAGSGEVAVWLRSDRAEPVVRFQLRDAGGRRTVEADPKAPQGRFGPWILAGAPLPALQAPAVLEAVEVSGAGRPGTVLAVVGRVVFQPGPADRTRAALAWKVHDVDWRKPSANDYTGTWLEYAWDRPPVFEVAQLLAAGRGWLPGERAASPDPGILRRDTASIRLEVRQPDGAPVAALEHRLADGPWVALPPLSGTGVRFVRVKAFAADGLLLGCNDLVVQILDDLRPAPAAPPAPAPLLAIEAPAWTRHLTGGDPRLAVRFPPGAVRAGLTIADTRLAVLQEVVLEQPGSLPLAALLRHPGRIHVIEAVYRDAAGRPIDTDWLAVGVPTPEAPPLAWPGPAGVVAMEDLFGPGRPGLFSENVMTTSDGLLARRLPQTPLPVLEERIRAAGSTLVLSVPWGELEPVEGCLQFDDLDAQVQRNRERGVPLMISINLAGDQVPPWLWYDAHSTADQRAIGGSYRYASLFSRRQVDALLRTWRQVVRRYGTDPGIIGWGLCAGGSEGLVRDLAPGGIGDYSPPARAAWQAWLAGGLGLDLDAINRRHGTAWTALAEVRPPVLARDGIDASPAARDFHAFRQQAVEAHLERLLAALRAEDPVRTISIYSMFGYGDISRLMPIYRRHRAILMNGGAESMWSVILNQLAGAAGVPTLPEPHDVPPDTYNLNQAAFNTIVSGGYSGLNICNGLVWAKNGFDRDPEQTGLVGWKRILRERLVPELIRTRVESGVGVLFSYRSGIIATGSFAPESHTPAIAALADAFTTGMPLSPRWLTEGAAVEEAAGLRLVVDTGSVLMDARLEALAAGILAQGGTLVAGPLTGLLGEDPAAPPRAWLGRLGLAVLPPEVAVAGADDPAWAQVRGAGPGVPAFGVAHPALRVLLRDGDGRPRLVAVPVGAGRLVLALGEIDWRRNRELLHRLLAWTGVAVPVASDRADLALGLVRDAQAGTWAVPVFRSVPNAPFYLKRAECVARGAVDARVRVHLPPGRYAVRELTAATPPEIMDATAIAAGVPCPALVAGDLRVIQFRSLP